MILALPGCFLPNLPEGKAHNVGIHDYAMWRFGNAVVGHVTVSS
jgi:hypothetical protein